MAKDNKDKELLDGSLEENEELTESSSGEITQSDETESDVSESETESLETQTEEEETSDSEEELTPKQLKAKKKREAKEEKNRLKLEAKQKKADDKIEELSDSIDELRDKIKDASDQKEKNKLRKQRDLLIEQRDGIYDSSDGMTIPMNRKSKRTLKAVLAIILIIVLLVVYVVTGAARHGLLSYFGVPQNTLTAFTVTDGDGNKHSVSVATYNYYFATQYNSLQNQQSQYSQYGLDLSSMNLDVDFDKKLSKQTTKNDDGETVTWAEYLKEEVEHSIKSTYSYYYEAVKANDGKEPDITDDQQSDIDDTISEYEDNAKSSGYALDGFFKAAIGKGVDEDLVRHEMKVSYIAQNYEEELNEKYDDKTYTDDEYNSYKKEHSDEMVGVDVKYFECSSADDAKAFKKKLKADGSNFAELAAKYASDDFDKEAYKDEAESTYHDLTRANLTSLSAAISTADDTSASDDDKTYSNLDWLFSKDRKAGDVNTDQDITSVVYVIKPVHQLNTKVVTVRHILVTPYFDDDDSSSDSSSSSSSAKDATDEQWKAAKKQAQKILDEYNDGDKTADAFGKLAKKYTEDSNGDDGGIYENIKPNDMVPTFNAWCFDSDRKEGDVDIVKTEYGYHIIYFQSTGDKPTWKQVAQEALAADDSEDDVNAIEDGYKISINSIGKYFFEIDTDIDY